MMHFFSVMGHAPCGKNARTAAGTYCFDEVTCPSCLRSMAGRSDSIGKYARKVVAKAEGRS